MANNQDIEKQKQLYRNIIDSKKNSFINGKIVYYWRKAQLSIVQSIQNQFSPQSIVSALQKTAKLQQQYANRHFPPFYCYYTLQALLKSKETFLQSIDGETRKVLQGNSEYEQMVIPLMLQQSLFETICKQTQSPAAQHITQLEQLHVLAILKINQWQLKMSSVLKYPAFFFWNQANYILSLEAPAIEKPESQIHSRIHSFLSTKTMGQDDSKQQCEKIIKIQKARELQLILNLPFFASLKKQHDQLSPAPESKSSFVRFNRALLKPAKSRLKLGSLYLKSEELQVLRKFRSLKSIKAIQREKTAFKKDKQEKSTIKEAIRQKLTTLKEQVKLNDSNMRLKQPQTDRISPADRKIKILIEKDIQLTDKAKPYQKIDFQELRSSRNEVKIGNKLKQHSKTQRSLPSLQNIARQLIAQKMLKQNEMQQKSKNLQAIKLQLVSKVQEKRNNSTKPLKNVQKSISIFGPERQVSIQKSQDLRQLNGKKTLQGDEIANVRNIEQQQQHLAAIVRLKLRNYEKLTQKNQKVSQLQQKLQQLKQSLPYQTRTDEQSSEKIKKQILFQMQKQNISSISKKLEQRVKAEEVKYQNLKRLEEQRQNEIKSRLERQVQVVQGELSQKAKLQQEKLKEEQLKKQQYQLKIAREKEENESMLKQIGEWELKEKELVLLIGQLTQKRKLKREEALAEQRSKLQQELAIIELRETQLINEYRSSNQNLVSMLELLKHKNHQIQLKLKQEKPIRH